MRASCEGDMVLVDRSKEAKNGDIVIARIDGAWTMKYLKKNGNKRDAHAGE